MAGRMHRLVRGAARAVVRLLLVLVVIEGTASWLGFFLDLPSTVSPPARERLHMQYDPELGWSSIPGTRLEDFYGDGRDLTISRQGMRAAHDIPPEPPTGRTRAICAGDELTLGIGVGDSETWCARLGARESGLETVNMGQGGYGLDQSYLWYRRDGRRLGAKLLIFAFTRDAFARMERDNVYHYGKPVLRVASNGLLQARNVPVPQTPNSLPWLARNARLFEKLRIVSLARPAFLASWTDAPPQLTMGELAELTDEVFTALKEMADESGATLVLVYLPSGAQAESHRDLWRRRVAQEARGQRIHFVDLVEAMETMQPGEAESLFAQASEQGPGGSTSVLTQAGHSWVAQTLSEQLRGVPELVAALRPSSAGIP